MFKKEHLIYDIKTLIFIIDVNISDSIGIGRHATKTQSEKNIRCIYL